MRWMRSGDKTISGHAFMSFPVVICVQKHVHIKYMYYIALFAGHCQGFCCVKLRVLASACTLIMRWVYSYNTDSLQPCGNG